MRITNVQRSALAATSILMVGGLALGACGGGGGGSKDDATKLLNAGLQAEVQGDYKTAQAKFEDLLKVDSNNKFANYNLGYIAQTANKDNATASKYYAAAIKTDPQYGPALYNLAIIETANGNTPTAIALYKRAVTADPTDANANLNLGFLLYQTGDKAGADAAFRKAIALNPALRQRIPANQQPNG
jgi:tetratricopeptide (TPR) repeat protein